MRLTSLTSFEKDMDAINMLTGLQANLESPESGRGLDLLPLG